MSQIPDEILEKYAAQAAENIKSVNCRMKDKVFVKEQVCCFVPSPKKFVSNKTIAVQPQKKNN